MWVDLDEYDNDDDDGQKPQFKAMMGANRAADSQDAYVQGDDIVAGLNDANLSLALRRQLIAMLAIVAIWGGSYFISPEIIYLTSCVAIGVGMIPLAKSARIIAGHTRDFNQIQTDKMDHLEAEADLRLAASQLDRLIIYPDTPVR